MTLALVLSAAWVATGFLAGWERHRLRDAAEAAAEWSPPAGRPGFYDLAALYGGRTRVVDSAAVTLVDRGVLAVGAGGLLVAGKLSDQVPLVPGVEVAVRARVIAKKAVALADVRQRLSADPGVVASLERAEALGLIVEPGPARSVLRRGAALTGATAAAAFVAWALQGVGVAAFVVIAAGTYWILAVVLPGPGMPTRRGLAIMRHIKAGAEAGAVLDDPKVVTGAGWLTALHGVATSRKLSYGLSALVLPGDPSPKSESGSNDWSFLHWLFDGDGDGDGCGGCGCG